MTIQLQLCVLRSVGGCDADVVRVRWTAAVVRWLMKWAVGGLQVLTDCLGALLTLGQLAVVALRGCLPAASPDKTLTQKFHLKVSLSLPFAFIWTNARCLKLFVPGNGNGRAKGPFFYGNFSKRTLRSLYDFGYFLRHKYRWQFLPRPRTLY